MREASGFYPEILFFVCGVGRHRLCVGGGKRGAKAEIAWLLVNVKQKKKQVSLKTLIPFCQSWPTW